MGSNLGMLKRSKEISKYGYHASDNQQVLDRYGINYESLEETFKKYHSALIILYQKLVVRMLFLLL